MDILIQGGPITIMILALCVAGMTVFLGKAFYLHKIHVNIQEFIEGLRNELSARRITEAVSICDSAPGPATNVLKAGIMHYEDGKVSMEKAMEKTAINEIARLEKGVPAIATIAMISPLLGFLGTVLGLMNIFNSMTQRGGLITSIDLSQGMWQALISTAFGMAVAVTMYMAYNYLVSRVQHVVRDIQICSADLVEILSE